VRPVKGGTTLYVVHPYPAGYRNPLRLLQRRQLSAPPPPYPPTAGSTVAEGLPATDRAELEDFLVTWSLLRRPHSGRATRHESMADFHALSIPHSLVSPRLQYFHASTAVCLGLRSLFFSNLLDHSSGLVPRLAIAFAWLMSRTSFARLRTA
jgi:hypothetical protein